MKNVDHERPSPNLPTIASPSVQSPIIDFVVLAVGRSGSNHLCSMLNADQMVVHLELFSPQAINYQYKSLAQQTLRHVTTAERDADPVGFLQRVKQADPGKIAGFKLFREHNNALAAQLIANPNVKKVILKRQNLLALYASRKIARATQKYVNTNPVARETVKAVFSHDDFSRYCAGTTAWYEFAEKSLAQSGQTYFAIDYTDINNEQKLFDLIVFLTGNPPSRARHFSPHVKTGSTDILSRFENAEKVRAYILEIGHADWQDEAV